MEPIVIIIPFAAIFLVWGYYKFIKWIIRLYKKTDKQSTVDRQTLVIIVNCVMPLWSIGSLYLLKKDFEVFDWNYLHSLHAILFISLCCFFISYFMKENVGPLLLLILAIGMILGIILLIFILIHLSFSFPFALIPPFLFICLPLFAIIPSIFLLFKELQAIYQFIIEKANSLEIPIHSNWLLFLRSSPVLLPLSVLAVSFIYLFKNQTSAIIKVFTEASEGLFASGVCENCPAMTDYLCSIAAQGNPKIVKPIRKGVRLGMPIVVTRQLLISNAFEEWLMVNFPAIHKPVRKAYDALNIPVNKWCRHKRIATLLFFVWKPFEWMGLLIIYLFEPNPEDLINRQYYENKRIGGLM